MNPLRFRITMPYCDRPNLLGRALASLLSQDHKDWHAVIVDDSTQKPCIPVIKKVIPMDLRGKFTIYTVGDTVQKKMFHGTRHGKFMNRAMFDATNWDLTLDLCDDDRLVDGALGKISNWFLAHPEEMYAWSMVYPYDPTECGPETPSPVMPPEVHKLNQYNGIHNPASRIDHSQFTVRRETLPQLGSMFPDNSSGNFDAILLDKLFRLYGPPKPMGFHAQWKGVWQDQMSNRLNNSARIYEPRDIEC